MIRKPFARRRPTLYIAINMRRAFFEFLLFLRREKRWWLIPLVVVLLALGALILLTSGSVVAPFLYPSM